MENSKKTIQLSIFSWQTYKIAEASQYLGQLEFDNAIESFREVFLKHPENTDSESGLQMSGHWQDMFQQSDFSDIEGLKYLYNQIAEYVFDKKYQSEILKKALLNYLIDKMNNKNQFFLSSDMCIADIYIELNEYEKAESVLKKYLKDNKNSSLIRCRLADTLWIQGKSTEANKNYIIALLTSPSEILIKKITNKKLLIIINNEGIEMSPVYGCLRGILPLINIEKLHKVADNKAINIYHTLFLAEKSRKNKDTKNMVKYRKKIKEIAPEFFDEYYKWLSQFK